MNIVFCGKGGVGKSTISSIYAMEFSKDKKTLIISIDQDHSLSIIFNKEIGNEIKEIKKNLYAIELDAQKIANNYINEVLENLESILNKKAFESVKNYSKFLLNSNIALNTAIIYGIYKIPKDFDIIIIDTPPSHQFISFLTTLFNLPKNLEIILKIYENWKNISENWADKNLKNYESLKQKHEIALDVQNFFKNSYYYIIINPQKVVIEVSYKLEEFLKSYKLNIKGIILNKFKHIL
ncbi:MAG: ArsA-related P-loop ATPase [candidate division WOR-3 bacterium]|jgi:arsenite-transporting ATPase